MSSVSRIFKKKKSKFLPSQSLVNRVASISVSLAFGQHSFTSTVNATVSLAFGSYSCASTVNATVSFAFGPYSYTGTVNATVGSWPSGSTLNSTPILFPNVLNAKQGQLTCILFKSFV